MGSPMLIADMIEMSYPRMPAQAIPCVVAESKQDHAPCEFRFFSELLEDASGNKAWGVGCIPSKRTQRRMNRHGSHGGRLQPHQIV